MTQEGGLAATRLAVPHAHCMIARPRRDGSKLSSHVQRIDAASVALILGHNFAHVYVPHHAAALGGAHRASHRAAGDLSIGI